MSARIRVTFAALAMHGALTGLLRRLAGCEACCGTP